MADTKTLLESDKFFHIFNHAVGNEYLFKSSSNYQFFLKRLNEYLHKYIDIYAYCLMANHFHLVVKIKCSNEILTEFGKNNYNEKEVKSTGSDQVPKIISRQFSHFFNSYAQAFNKENKRKGSLFNNRFKRIHIDTVDYLRRVIIYVHNNPVKAGIVHSPAMWDYSSFNSVIFESNSFIKRKEIIELFEDLENFISCHSEDLS